MQKMRMMMIPSVGYFTVISKNDQQYLDYLNENLHHHYALVDCKDEDHILECLLGDTLRRLGWKICFLSETDVYLQNKAT